MKKQLARFTTFIFILVIALASCSKKSTSSGGSSNPPPPPPPPPPAPTALVYTASNGKLAYNKFSNEGETDKINTIPDFSMAGYVGGGVSLPNASVKKTLTAVAGDNRALIQAAIDEVENLAEDANGLRGAVLLKAGNYDVSGPLYIEKNGVILRGEGQGITGTILKATQTAQHTLIQIKGTGSGSGEVGGTRKKITTSYVPTGALSFDVETGSLYAAGDNIAVYRVPNQLWIDDLQMAQYGWTLQDYDIAFERKIKSVNGNTVTVDAPVVDPIQNKYGGGFIYKTAINGRISNCGVENMRLVSVYANNDDENHGWNAVSLSRAQNCWIKQVTAQYFGYSCVSITGQSVFNTIEECAMLDPKSETTGGRKYSFNIEGGASFNLFQRCFTRGGRHDFVTGSRVPGPNVFLDCYATDTHSDIGPHHRWATGLLFDNVYGGQIHVQNRKASGTGHGWAGAQTLFWNCFSYKNDIEVESPKGAKNWGIGCVGPAKTGPGYWESWGTPVQPRSIYMAQLNDRLGNSAVNNITTIAQQNGTIRTLLKDWAGEGKLKDQ